MVSFDDKVGICILAADNDAPFEFLVLSILWSSCTRSTAGPQNTLSFADWPKTASGRFTQRRCCQRELCLQASNNMGYFTGHPAHHVHASEEDR
jgi:hypothetical protein